MAAMLCARTAMIKAAALSCLLMMVQTGSLFVSERALPRSVASRTHGDGQLKLFPAISSLRLRGGGFGRAATVNERAKSLSDPTEFYREFGTGPSLDCSATSFEIKPDSFNDTDSLMDGMGMWDYPEEERLVGEHHAARVGHRVKPSRHLKEFWARYNWTDWVDGWDHQNERLGTVVAITDDGRLTEVKWDEQNGLPGAIDWYATGYLNNFFLSLAEDDLQPVFQDLEKLHKIKKLEEELAKLKREAEEET